MNDDLNILLSATLDTDTSVDNINKKIKDIQKGLKELNISLDIGDLREQFKKVFGDMATIAEKEAKKANEEVGKELEKMTHRFTDYGSALTDGFNTEQFKKDLKELRQEIKSIENIKVNYGKDESGEGIGKLDSVLVTYKDHMGQLVHETLAWAEITNEEAKEVEHRWQTISTTVEENRRKISDYADALSGFKDKMNFKLDLLGDSKDIDPKVIEHFRERLDGIGGDIDTAKEEMKSFVLEVQKLDKSSQSIKQMENLSNALSSFKDKANFKLDMLESTKDVDPSKIKELREAVNGLDVNSENVKQSMKELGFEIQKTSQTSEKYVDKQKKLSELESKRIVLNRELSDLMRDSGVADNKKADFSKQYSEIAKELTTMAKTSKEYTQSEISGLSERMKKLKELISMEVRYQDQLDDRDRTSRRKNNMLDTVSGVREDGMIDASVLDDLARRIKAVKDNSTDAKDELDAIDDVLKKVVKESVSELNKLEQAKKDAFDLSEFKKMQGNKLDLLGDTDASKAQIEALRQKLNALTADTPNLRQEMKTLSNDIQVLGTQAQKTSGTMAFLARYFGFQEVIQLSKRAISSMVEAVKDLDSELTELRKVTDFSAEGLDNFTKSAFDVANQIGRTGTELVSASAEWARAGFDESELMGLAETSLIMTNIGDGIEDVAEASSYLISALKAYSLEANKAMDVTSAINEVSNNNAIGFQKLAEGISRTASVYSQAGTSMEELLGLLTGAYEINRNIEKTSSGLITISTRLRSIQLDGEEAVIPIAKLQDTFSSIAGVDIMDKQTKQLRSTYDILKDLASVWDTLDTNMQESIAFASAGTRQKSVFLDLMKNFDAVDKAMLNATDSTGSAMKENEVFMESIAGKLNQLSSAWSEFSNKTISSDFVKGIIDMTTSLINFVSEGKLAVPILIGMAGAVALVHASSKADGIIGLVGHVKSLGTATVVTTIATEALNIALLGIASAGIVLGIVGIVKAFDVAITTIEEQTKKIQELTNEYDKLYAKKQELSNVEFKTEAQKEELALVGRQLEIQEQLLAIEKEKLAIKQYSGKGVWGKGEWGDFDKESQKIKQTLNALANSKQEYDTIMATWSQEELDKYSDDDMYLENIKNKKEDLVGVYADLTDKLSNARENLKFFTNDEDIEKQRQYIADLEELIGLVGVATGLESPYKDIITSEVEDQIRNTSRATKEQVDAVIYALAVENEQIYTMTDLKNAQEKWKSEVLATYPELATLYATVEDGTVVMGEQLMTYEEMITKFSDVSDEIDFLSKTLKELNDDHTLSASTIAKLAKEYPQLLRHMDDEASMNKALQELIKDREQAQIESFELMAMEAFNNSEYMQSLEVDLRNELISILNDYHDAKAEGYTGDLEAYAKMESEKAKISQKLINELKKAWASYFQGVSDSVGRQIDSVADMSSEDYDKLDNIQKASLNKLSQEKQAIKATTDDIIKNMLESVDITIGEAGGLTRPKTKSDPKKSSDKTQKELDNLIKNIQHKREIVDKEIGMIEEKISLAQLKGDGKAVDEYSIQLSELLTLRKQLTEQENVSFRALQEKYKDSESQMKLEQLIYENSKEWWSDRKSEYEQELEMLTLKYDRKNELIAQKEKELELEMALIDSETSPDRERYLELQVQVYDNILARQENVAENLAELYRLGIDLESDHVKELKELYHSLEKQRLDWIKERAETERKYMLETKKEELDILKEREQSIKSLTDIVVKMLKDEAKQRKDNLKEELDGYKKIIDAKKEILDQEKEERDYQKGLEEKQKSITKMENKILELSLDNSAKAQAEKAKLEEELLKLREELEDYQYENAIEKQKENLDKEYENFKESIDQQIDDIDDYLSKEGKLREEALKLIEKDQKNLYNKLMKWGLEYSDLTRAELQSIWEDGTEALSSYNDGQLGALETLNHIILSMQALNSEIKELESSSWSQFIDSSKVEGNVGSSTKPPTSEESNAWKLEDAKKDLQVKQQAYLHSLMVEAKNSQNKGLEQWVISERARWGMGSDGTITTQGLVPDDEWQKKKKDYGFKRGGETQFTGLHWLDGEKGKPERVLTSEQTQAFNKLIELAPSLNTTIASVTDILGSKDGLNNLLETIPSLSMMAEKVLNGQEDSKQATVVEVNFENMVNIEGNVDKTIDLEDVIKRASKQAINDLQNTLSNIGISKRISFR